MSQQALSGLNARLIEAELAAGVGRDWFASWLSALREIEGGATLSPQLESLAARLDAVLLKVQEGKALAPAATSEKRAQSETELVSEAPAAKKTTESGSASSAVSEVAETTAVGGSASANVVTPVDKAAAVSEQAAAVASEPITDQSNVPEAPKSKLATFLQPEPTAAVESPPTVQQESSSKPAETKLASFIQPDPAVEQQSAAQKESNSKASEVSNSKLAAFLASAEPEKTEQPSSKPSPSTVSTPSSPSKPSPFASFESKYEVPKTSAAAPSAKESPVTKSSSPLPPAATKSPSPLPSSASPKASSASENQSPLKQASSITSSSSPSPSSQAKEKPTIAKQSEGGHMEIPQEVADIFQEIKIRKKHRFVTLRIQDWKLEIVKVGERSATFEDFMKELPFSDCRFAVYDHENLKTDQYGSRKAEKVYFVTWQPVPAPTTMKMLYSTERRTLNAVFKGVEEIVATKRDDILVATGQKSKFAADESDDEERGGDDWMDD